MATFTPPYADPGIASFEKLDTYTQNFLLAGNHPELAPAYSYPVKAGVVLEQFSVVGLDATGFLVKAVQAAEVTPVQAIGVLAHAVTGGAADGDVNAPVWYSGCFNMDALVWGASFNTDAEKAKAFHGAPTPTTIIVAKRGA
jgi:hypothetical protein